MQMHLNQPRGTTPEELAAAKFINRSYGGYNVRNGYFYPESPYALALTKRNALAKNQPGPGMGDLVPMGVPFCQDPSMACGTMSVLPNTASIVAGLTPSSLLPSASDQGLFASAPSDPVGTYAIVPYSASVPSVQSSILQSAGDGPVAATVQTAQPGQSIAPITLTGPMPSILQPRSNQVNQGQMQGCSPSWVSEHPLLSIGLAAGVFLLFKGKKK